MRFANMRLATRLQLGFGGMLLLLLLSVLGAFIEIRKLHDDVAELANNWLPSVEHTSALNTNTSDLRILEFQHVLNTDERAMAKIESEMVAVKADFQKHMAAYAPLVSSPQEKALLDSFLQDWRRYTDIHEQVLSLSRANIAPAP